MYVIYGANSDLARSLIPYLNQNQEEVISVSRKRSEFEYCVHIFSELLDIDFNEIPDESIWVLSFGKVGINFSEHEKLDVIKINFVYVAFLASLALRKKCRIIFPSTQRASLVNRDDQAVKTIKEIVSWLDPSYISQRLDSEQAAIRLSHEVLALLGSAERHNIYDLSKALAESFLLAHACDVSKCIRIGNLFGDGFLRGVISRLSGGLARFDNGQIFEQQRVIYPISTHALNKLILACSKMLPNSCPSDGLCNAFPTNGHSIPEIVQELRNIALLPGGAQCRYEVNEKVWQRSLTDAGFEGCLDLSFLETTFTSALLMTSNDIDKSVKLIIAADSSTAQCIVVRSVDYCVVQRIAITRSDHKSLKDALLDWIVSHKYRIEAVIFSFIEMADVHQPAQALFASSLRNLNIPFNHVSLLNLVDKNSGETPLSVIGISDQLLNNLRSSLNPKQLSLSIRALSRDLANFSRELTEGFSTEDAAKVQLACDFLDRAFSFDFERGPLFIRHCLTVAMTAKANFFAKKIDLVVAAIIHDVFEHSNVSSALVTNYFGSSVSDIVLLLSQNKIYAMDKFYIANKEADYESDFHIFNMVGQERDNFFIKLEHFTRLIESFNEQAILLKVIDNFHNYTFDQYSVSQKPRFMSEIALFFIFLRFTKKKFSSVEKFYRSRKFEFDFLFYNYCPNLDLESFEPLKLWNRAAIADVS